MEIVSTGEPQPTGQFWALTSRNLTTSTRVVASLAKSTVSKAWRDRILGLSAEAAFWQLMSLPPLLLAILGGLGYIGPVFGTDVAAVLSDRILLGAQEVATPEVVDQVIRPVVNEVFGHVRPDVVSIGFFLALWAGSSATSTFVNTITIAYGQRELRGALKSRLLALRVYLISLVASAILLPLLVVGPGLLVRAVPSDWHHTVNLVVRLVYWPITTLLTFGALATLYHVSTPRRLRWRRAYPGAVLALVLFVLLSSAVRFYLEAVASRFLVFSALALPVLMLLYFYVLALAILLGAELNAALELRWPKGTRQRPLEALSNRLRRAFGSRSANTPDENLTTDDDGDHSGDVDRSRSIRPPDRPSDGPAVDGKTRSETEVVQLPPAGNDS
jgi:membrane protein